MKSVTSLPMPIGLRTRRPRLGRFHPHAPRLTRFYLYPVAILGTTLTNPEETMVPLFDRKNLIKEVDRSPVNGLISDRLTAEAVEESAIVVALRYLDESAAAFLHNGLLRIDPPVCF
jgi:hypothetical protein